MRPDVVCDKRLTNLASIRLAMQSFLNDLSN